MEFARFRQIKKARFKVSSLTLNSEFRAKRLNLGSSISQSSTSVKEKINAYKTRGN